MAEPPRLPVIPGPDREVSLHWGGAGRATPPLPSREDVLAFLNGEGPLDGKWFGERVPLRWGQFWWRKYLVVFEDDD